LNRALGLLAGCALCACAQKPAPAVLSEVRGHVRIQESHDSGLRAVSPGQELPEGCWLHTSRDGRAVVSFPDGSRIELAPSSTFSLQQQNPEATGLRFTGGLFRAAVSPQRGRRFRIQTPAAVASVRGTDFRVYVKKAGGTTIDLFSGALSVQDNQGVQRDISGGQRWVVDMEQGLSGAAAAPIPAAVQAAPLEPEAPGVHNAGAPAGRRGKRDKLLIPNDKLRFDAFDVKVPPPPRWDEARAPDSELEPPKP
jgi:hypothetical protein